MHASYLHFKVVTVDTDTTLYTSLQQSRCHQHQLQHGFTKAASSIVYLRCLYSCSQDHALGSHLSTCHAKGALFSTDV